MSWRDWSGPRDRRVTCADINLSGRVWGAQPAQDPQEDGPTRIIYLTDTIDMCRRLMPALAGRSDFPRRQKEGAHHFSQRIRTRFRGFGELPCLKGVVSLPYRIRMQ